MWNKTWGFVPVKHDSAGTAFFETAADPFSANQHPVFSSNSSAGQSKQSEQTVSIGGGWNYTVASEISEVAFPGYGHNHWFITNGPKAAFGNNGAGSPDSYPGRDIEDWDKPHMIGRTSRKNGGNSHEDSNRQEGSYPYLNAEVGYFRSSGGSSSVNPLTWTEPHYYTIWETDQIVSPGTYSVTLQNLIKAYTLYSGGQLCPILQRFKYKLYFVAK